jgi:hypothetical protein
MARPTPHDGVPTDFAKASNRLNGRQWRDLRLCWAAHTLGAAVLIVFVVYTFLLFYDL